jgi:hypothetical protein
MSKRSIIEIMDDMDRLEKIEITDEFAGTLKNYFKDEIESENSEKDQNEKAAKGIFDDLVGLDKGNDENGQSDRV